MKKILSIVAVIVMAVVATSCNDNGVKISGDAPSFTISDKDQVVNTEIKTADRYYAEADETCKIVNGKKMKNPALIGVSHDTMVVADNITRTGEEMNAAGWINKSQIKNLKDGRSDAVGAGNGDDTVVADMTTGEKVSDKSSNARFGWFLPGLWWLWRAIAFLLSLALLVLVIFGIVRLFQYLYSLPWYTRRDHVVDSLTGTINTLATNNTTLATNNTTAMNAMVEQMRNRPVATTNHYYGNHVDISGDNVKSSVGNDNSDNSFAKNTETIKVKTNFVDLSMFTLLEDKW